MVALWLEAAVQSFVPFRQAFIAHRIRCFMPVVRRPFVPPKTTEAMEKGARALHQQMFQQMTFSESKGSPDFDLFILGGCMHVQDCSYYRR